MRYKDLVFQPHTTFLVTGGAGFIGSNLCEALLAKGYNVRCLDNFSTGKVGNIATFQSQNNFSLIPGDIRDFDTCMTACKQVDYVLHQAAWGSVPRSIEMPLLYEEINIRGTLNLLEAAKRCQVKRFVYASSSSVYGDEPTLPKIEGKEGALLSPYALTKKANEESAKLYTRIFGLDTIGLRYFNVFGRRQDPCGNYAAVIPKFVKELLNGGSPIIFGDGTQSRDFTYIENVVEINLKACLAANEAVGQVYNVACGGQVSLLDLHRKLCALLAKRIQPTFAPMRKGDIMHSNADISKAVHYLNYDPEYSFDKGIELTIEWYKNNL